MFCRYLTFIAILGVLVSSCSLNLNAPENGDGTDTDTTANFQNLSSANLPANLSGTTNAAASVDVDNDGDRDIGLALAFESNLVLVNDGSGTFSIQTLGTSVRLDSRGILAARLNTDTYSDLFVANNSSQTSELYFNNSDGTFTNLNNRIPGTGSFTSTAATDINQDNATDILVGSIGRNRLFQNNGNGLFSDESVQRLPELSDATHDVAFGHINNDNFPDIVIANGNANRILINTGSGFFSNRSNRYSFINQPEESRDVELFDADGDGDLDIYVGNSSLQEGANPQDRLLINDGSGFFSDQTADRLPSITTDTFAAAFSDLDGDGDPDIVVGNYNGGIRVLINNGSGFYSDETESWIPGDYFPLVTDIAIADYNSDGLPDMYIATRESHDQLLIQRTQE